ncbi:cytochrome P450 [Nocardiopsis trehalosi]|uniref:cytochrome P450 n=1 Tax=Nocardiopsis trehalosi TaxID=109329 RepID=UPI0008378B22|nr:cytochrome P450 [Nocardiopsis trehalosi]
MSTPPGAATGATTAEPVVLPVRRDPHHPFDPPPELAGLRARGPLTRLAFPDGHVGWLVTGHAAARAVLGDPRFSIRRELKHGVLRSIRPGAPVASAPPGFFGDMDAPEHTRYRRLLTRHFTVQRMRRLEPRIARITEERLDTMARDGAPRDLVPDFALPIPSLVICELLGVPYADHAHFQELTAAMLSPDGTAARAQAAADGLAAYVGGQVRRRRTEPGGGLIDALAAEPGLTDEEITNISLLLLVAGHETTAHMLALGAFALLRHPDQLAALRADPGPAGGAVEELLRYLSILSAGAPSRAALEDVELAGYRVRAGETVVVSLPAANRDPGVFPDPGALRLDRDNARHHLALGHGIHQCLGQQLARVELRIALPALMARFPDLRLAVPAEEVPMREGSAIHGPRRLPVAWGGPA